MDAPGAVLNEGIVFLYGRKVVQLRRTLYVGSAELVSDFTTLNLIGRPSVMPVFIILQSSGQTADDLLVPTHQPVIRVLFLVTPLGQGEVIARLSYTPTIFLDRRKITGAFVPGVRQLVIII